MKSKLTLQFLVLAFGFLASGLTSGLAQETTIKTGQSLQIKVTGIPQEDQVALGGVLTIGDDGLLRLQYINPVKAIGLKPSDLAKRIEAEYKSAEIYTNPTVNILAADPEGTRFISVLGEVRQPTNVPYRPGMTVLDAIAACGGFSDFAKPKEIKLVSGGETRVLDLRKAGGADASIKIKIGDQIIVPD